MNMLSEIDAKFWPRQEAANRFNKLFGEASRQIRTDIGQVKAKHGSKGVLRSGATIKVAIECTENRIRECVDECLLYVAAKTETDGWKRRRLLTLLRDELAFHGKSVWEMLDEQVVQQIGAGRNAGSSAEHSFEQTMERSLDRIEKFAEGIGQPKIENWAIRHPILANGVSGLIGASIGYLFSLFGA